MCIRDSGFSGSVPSLLYTLKQYNTILQYNNKQYSAIRYAEIHKIMHQRRGSIEQSCNDAWYEQNGIDTRNETENKCNTRIVTNKTRTKQTEIVDVMTSHKKIKKVD